MAELVDALASGVSDPWSWRFKSSSGHQIKMPQGIADRQKKNPLRRVFLYLVMRIPPIQERNGMTTTRGSGSSGKQAPGGVQLDAFGDPLPPAEGGRKAGGKAPARSPSLVEQAALSSLLLPVSGRTVNCRFALLDPAKCIPSPLNRRVQALLTTVNQDVRALMDSLRDEGQREPVLARPVVVNGRQRHEIIYGTRRRFALEQLALESGAVLKLKAWVVDDIADEDAIRLAISENENRSSISAWEMGQYLKSRLAQNPDWTHEHLAASEGIHRSLATRYLQLADLDQRFISLLAAPSGMTLTGGLAIRALAAKHPARVPAVLAELEARSPVADAAALLKLLRLALDKPSRRHRDQRLPIRSTNGAVRGQMVRHRTKPGCYKIDLAGLSEAQAERIRQAIETSLS